MEKHLKAAQPLSNFSQYGLWWNTESCTLRRLSEKKALLGITMSGCMRHASAHLYSWPYWCQASFRALRCAVVSVLGGRRRGSAFLLVTCPIYIHALVDRTFLYRNRGGWWLFRWRYKHIHGSNSELCTTWLQSGEESLDLLQYCSICTDLERRQCLSLVGETEKASQFLSKSVWLFRLLRSYASSSCIPAESVLV